MKDDTSLIWLNFKSVSYTQKENDNFLASEKKTGSELMKKLPGKLWSTLCQQFSNDFKTPYASTWKILLLQILVIMDKPLNF